MGGVYNGSGGGVRIRKAKAVERPRIVPAILVDNLTPALVAGIISQAQPTYHWNYLGVDLVGGDDLDEGSTIPTTTISPTLGGLVSVYTSNGSENRRASLGLPGVGDVGVETVTLMVILGDPVLTAGRGVFSNNDVANGFLLHGATGAELEWEIETPSETITVQAACGTGAEVVVCTRSIAGDIIGLWTGADSDVTTASLAETLTSTRPVQIGANALNFSSGFDCPHVMQWVGTDGDFGAVGDFAAARLAMAQALKYEA